MKLIPLTRGLSTTVDDEDYRLLGGVKWTANAYNYAIRIIGSHNKQKCVWLHRAILWCPDGMEIDHIDRNPLNNQRSNLRIATRSQNTANQNRTKNKTGFKGVNLRCDGKKWMAAIKLNKIKHYLGSFETKEEAARAYDKKAREFFGEFAVLNFKD